MTRKKLPNGLTQQQEDFCKYFVKYGIGTKALLKAYPKAKAWKDNSIYCQVQKLLNKPLVNQRINELNEAKTTELLNTTKLSHRKLLETAIKMLEDTNNPTERGHAVNLLKLLFQKEGMTNPENAVNVNINNTNITNDIANYLDL